MQRFVPRLRGTAWPDGISVLHVYALPDLGADPELARLIDSCRTAMIGHPISPVADEHLHCTVEMIAVPSDMVTSAARADLAAALRSQLAGTAAIQATAGSPLAIRAGVVLDLHPDAELAALRDRAREAIVEICGPGALQHPGTRPHMSLGYAHGQDLSDTLPGKLRRLSPSHAPLAFRNAVLVDVRWQQQELPGGGTAWCMSWELLATIPLTARPTTR